MNGLNYEYTDFGTVIMNFVGLRNFHMMKGSGVPNSNGIVRRGTSAARILAYSFITRRKLVSRMIPVVASQCRVAERRAS